MEQNLIIKILRKLTMLDIDNLHAYDRALQHINDTHISINIIDFRNDHIRHINDLSNLIQNYDANPPEIAINIANYLIKGISTIPTKKSTINALKTMRLKEVIAIKIYKTVLKKSLCMPVSIKKLIINNYCDKKLHLNYIQLMLANFEKQKKSESRLN